ncbi:MAG: hypothetical protein COT74_13315 [Bdellovibrionales bacterium CG10_big_fil_rev_8_21_14_0_10_45_34]|nr:MAG: hypothetical protein COT74_13315 [Bdellovibrionales bacterium CG10_big_fil_rev_8_21_14_0_10_45_34]
MKTLSILSVFFISSQALAATEVVVTAWQRLNTDSIRDGAAEVCGYLKGEFTGNEKLNVTVDKGRNQGEYATFVTDKGRFCLVVNTYLGRVEVVVSGTGASTSQDKFLPTKK